ncbi:hypothetical protein Tco_0298855 [Tanacetum coccineum]
MTTLNTYFVSLTKKTNVGIEDLNELEVPSPRKHRNDVNLFVLPNYRRNLTMEWCGHGKVMDGICLGCGIIRNGVLITAPPNSTCFIRNLKPKLIELPKENAKFPLFEGLDEILPPVEEIGSDSNVDEADMVSDVEVDMKQFMLHVDKDVKWIGENEEI